jgi:hypothetical protein
MSEEMYAFSELEGAFSRTKSLLWPVRWGVWLRLAVIAFFVGGGINMPNTVQYRFSGNELPPGFAEISSGVAPVLVAVFAAVLVIALVYILVSATMQFVFVDDLRTGDIRLRRFFRERFGKGIRLFLFQLGLLLLMILVLLALFALIFGLGFGGPTALGLTAPLLIVVLIPFILIFAVLFGIVFLFTTDFVVPIMIHDDCGVIEGWRRLCPGLSSQVGQTVVYIVVRFILGILAAILQAIVSILALVIIAIPFVLIGLALLAFLPLMNIAVLVALLIPYLIIAIPVALLIAVPFITFFRYYSLLVLGGLSPGHRVLSA